MSARSTWRIERQASRQQNLEERLATVMRSENDGTLKQAVETAVKTIENYGCSTEFVCRRPGDEQTQDLGITILSLDLVWLSSGRFGTWSEKGKQACYCLEKDAVAADDRSPWYQRVLDKFFSTHGNRSLLTYPDIYTRPLFLEVAPLHRRGALFDIASRDATVALPQGEANQIWRSTFTPDPFAHLSVHEWDHRFQYFRELLGEEIRVEFGPGSDSDVLLAWVYVSAGSTQPETPPPWAASLFLVFRFNGDNRPGQQGDLIERDLNLLLSNLSQSLQASSRTCLPEPAKHDMAQALAHEFKNLNQDVAVLSEFLMSDFARLPQKLRDSLAGSFHGRLSALHCAAQAATSFSLAAYWIASRDWRDLELRPDDQSCSIFSHVLFLAIRLVAETRMNWILVGIPEIGAIVEYLEGQLALTRHGSVTALLRNRCISIMMFFALEPVRNIRSDSTQNPNIRVSVVAEPGRIFLLQETTEFGKDKEITSSGTIQALMQITADLHDQSSFIRIEPDVVPDFYPTSERNVFLVRRRTTIHVEQIPYPKTTISG